MSNLKVYGVAGSRAYRVLWMVNELGLDYEHVPVHFGDGSAQKPEYLAINPNGRIPAIDDDGLKLWESMAINLYLAKKHRSLWLDTLEGEAQALQWSFWVITEVEKPTLTALLHRIFLPEDKRDPKLADEGEQQLQRPLKVLEDALAKDRLSGWIELFGRRSQCGFHPVLGAAGASRSLRVSAREAMAHGRAAAPGRRQGGAQTKFLSEARHPPGRSDRTEGECERPTSSIIGPRYRGAASSCVSRSRMPAPNTSMWRGGGAGRPPC